MERTKNPQIFHWENLKIQNTKFILQAYNISNGSKDLNNKKKYKVDSLEGKQHVDDEMRGN